MSVMACTMTVILSLHATGGCVPPVYVTSASVQPDWPGQPEGTRFQFGPAAFIHARLGQLCGPPQSSPGLASSASTRSSFT